MTALPSKWLYPCSAVPLLVSPVLLVCLASISIRKVVVGLQMLSRHRLPEVPQLLMVASHVDFVPFFFFLLELGKVVKTGTSYGIVGATKGEGEKETMLIVLWLSSLLLVFLTHLLAFHGSGEAKSREKLGSLVCTWCHRAVTLLWESAQLLLGLFLGALGQLGQSALLLHVPVLPLGTASVCGCGSQALAELQMSATDSAQNHVLYRFTTLQLLVAHC